MPIVLGPVVTQDDYVAALTIPATARAKLVELFVGPEGSVKYRVFYGQYGQSDEVQEVTGFASAYYSFEFGANGIQVRSAVAGTPVTVTARVWLEAEPLPAPPVVGAGGGSTPVVPSTPLAIVTQGEVVTNSGTPKQLPAVAIQAAAVKALTTNTGLVYVGDSAVVVGGGLQLAADDGVTFDLTNLDSVWFDVDVSGEGVSYLAIG